MFNLFKKQTKEESVIFNAQAPTKENPNNYPKEVLEIHHEFSIAADKILEEANVVLKEAATKNATKVNRLEALGFKQANEVSQLKPLLQKAELSKEQIELVGYYQRNYPLNKFITEDQVKAICFKWNLVCGEVGKFKGFVPEKNLREIEKFKLNQSDKGVMTNIGVFIPNAEVRRHGGFYHIYKIGERDEYNYAWQSNEGERFYHIDSKNIFNLDIDRSFLVIKGLHICAPVKDMDMTGMTITEGYKMHKIHVPDPVVLQPVKGGYLIITAWGDEASDPNVVNQINN